MRTQRMIRLAFVPLTALALIVAFLFLVTGEPTPAMASSPTDWQQTNTSQPMTHTTPMSHTMPMTEATPSATDHQGHHGQGAPREEKGM